MTKDATVIIGIGQLNFISAMFSEGVKVAVRVATEDDAANAGLVEKVVLIVNEAYTRGEEGMWKGTASRTNIEEMTSFLSDGRIILAYEAATGAIVGSILVTHNFGEHLGELGMLCVAQTHLRQGLGKILVKAAEDHCRLKGCTEMRLELLKPAKFVHPVKTWLHEWYTSLGYIQGNSEDFASAFPRIAPLLACDCLFTVYKKQL